MSFDHLSLQCFLSVAGSGSFTKAAERVGRTQSAVSQQISKLEQTLGVTLLKREKKVSLTSEGEVFFNYAHRIISLHHEVIDRFKEESLKGEIRFGVPEDFATFFLADVLADFSRIHPGILLNVECDLTLNLLERFKNSEFDIVLTKMICPKDFPLGVNLLTESLEWVCSQSLRDALEKERALPLVLSPQPCIYRTRALQALETAELKWRIVYTSSSYAGTLAAVKAGLGLTVLPKNMIPKNLTYINSDFLPKLDKVHISFLKQSNNNKSINSFEKFVLNKIR
ncbi:MAG TPA: LysR family transcriptional regulator [Alphaproteobacteria bacterium]|nr:LysR family transcriptional regulator [Alphaproteobacteria bacterium]